MKGHKPRSNNKRNKRIDWSKALKTATRHQQVKDYARIREMIYEMYRIFRYWEKVHEDKLKAKKKKYGSTNARKNGH